MVDKKQNILLFYRHYVNKYFKLLTYHIYPGETAQTVVDHDKEQVARWVD